tara:strand:+ start:50 stop:334 length:285 start_codon:yes stop_codon:yes gene_type:complete
MKIIFSVLSIIFFISCNTSQRKISNWTEEEKELIFKDCINYSLDIKVLNLNESNKYCNCVLRILVTKFDSKNEAEESLIKNITSNSIYIPCEKY